MTFRVGRKGTLVPDFTAELTWSGTGQVQRESPVTRDAGAGGERGCSRKASIGTVRDGCLSWCSQCLHRK
jgi:hypothetical protein